MDKKIKRSAAIEAHLTEDIFPFFSFLTRGAESGRDNTTDGKYAFYLTKKGTFYHTGSIMPVNLITDLQIKEKLLNAIRYLQTLPIETELADSRKLLQEHLDMNGLNTLQVGDWNDLKGWVAFAPTREFFEDMLPYLNYVTALEIQDDGYAHVHESACADWKNMGDLSFWMNGWPDKEKSRYELPMLYLVFELIDQAKITSRHWVDYDLKSLPFDLRDFFTLNPDTHTSTISAWFSETKTGWCTLILTLDGIEQQIVCSNAYDPFPSLLMFLQSIENGDLPIQLNIDEEGTEKRLEAFATNEPDKFYFVLSDPYADNDQRIFHGIFYKKEFVDTMKTGLRDFFWNRYVPSEWEWHVDEENENFHKRALNEPWMNS